jgi:hypothetical protein
MIFLRPEALQISTILCAHTPTQHEQLSFRHVHPIPAEYGGDLKRFGPEKYPEQLQEMAASGGPVIRVEPWTAQLNHMAPWVIFHIYVVIG